MPNFPCPNPACRHEFTPEEVHGAGALKCPLCGQVFQFRAGAIPAKPPSRPSQSLPPLAKPVVPSGKPAAANGTAKVEESPFKVEEPLARFRRPRWTRKQIISLAAGTVLGLGVVILAAWGIRSYFTPSDNSEVTEKGRVITGYVRNEQNAEEKAFKLILADKVWAADHQKRQRLGVTTAWKSLEKDKEGWVAVSVRDYGTARPRQAELLRVGIEKLDEYFEGNLELAEKAEPVQIDGVAGQRLLFKGQHNAVVWWGHIYMLTHHGLGYWYYIAAPSKAEAEELYSRDLQGNFGLALHTERQGWREQPPRRDRFTSAGGVVTVTVPAGLFEKHSAKDQDERGALYLFAKYQKEKDNRKNADVLVLALDKAGDAKEAFKAAGKYLVEEKQKESKEYKLESTAEEASTSDLGVPQPVGNRPGRVGEFRLLRGGSPARFWLVGVVNEAETVYVIRCDCAWENRQIWREEFQELLKTVRFGKD